MSSNRLKAFAALGGMFVLGAVSSAAVNHAIERRDYAEFFSGDRDSFEARRLEAMARELELSGEQTTKVGEIFRKHAEERRQILRKQMETCGGPMSEHRERIDAEIRAVLTPVQRERFEKIRAERHRRLFGDAPPP